MRRGWSYHDLVECPEELFEYYFLFDNYVERDDSVLDQYRYASLSKLVLGANGVKNDFKLRDFDMCGLMDDSAERVSTERLSTDSNAAAFVNFIKTEATKKETGKKVRKRNGKK